MEFKYFDQPELFSSFTSDTTKCDTCNNKTKCFDAGHFNGTEEIKAICADCLAGGKLYEKDIYTCSGDIATLKQQLKDKDRSFTNAEIEKIAIQKTDELEKTTPALISWQDWDWPCADGDYCRFIGYGSIPLYEKLAGDNDPMQFFIDSFYDASEDTNDAETLWAESLPSEAIKNYNDSNQCSTLFYVFKSLNSAKIITIWDSE